jgi:hypothetical protein
MVRSGNTRSVALTPTHKPMAALVDKGAKITTSLECTPASGHSSGREIDHPPGLFLFELDGAPVSERGMEPLAVVDLLDEAGQ